MYSVWTKNIKDSTEKDQFERSLRNSKWILDRQTEILTEMEAGLDRGEMTPARYDIPGWPFKQAHSNGFRQAIREIKNLINLDQREPNG